MSDTTFVPGTTVTASPAIETQQTESPAIKQIREQLQAEKQARAATEERLKTLEREKLDELERNRLEKEDAVKARQQAETELTTLRDEHGRFASAIERIYNDELSSVPEDKREAVTRLSSFGTWSERLESLRNVKALFPTPPVQAGSRTQPTGASATPAPSGSPPATPVDPTKVKNMSWDSVLPTAPTTTE